MRRIFTIRLQWAASLHLTKAAGGFEGKVKVPWGTRIPYKFIVDGRWTTLQSQPQEPDSLGNLNNIYDSVRVFRKVSPKRR